jgi:hypothetical protein
MKVEQ